MLLLPLYTYSPLMAEWAALVFVGALAAYAAWQKRALFPWRLQVVRIDKQEEPVVAAAARASNFSNFRISYAQPHLSEPLAKYVVEADEMLLEKLESEKDLNEWKRKYQSWDDRVFQFIETRISASKALSYREFVRIASVYDVKFPNALGPEHNALLNALQRRRDEVRRIQAIYME